VTIRTYTEADLEPLWDTVRKIGTRDAGAAQEFGDALRGVMWPEDEEDEEENPS
jgi:hypothetical protein